MASKETVNIQQAEAAEAVVNRWLVDYYLFLAIDLLKKELYDDFRAIRNVLDCVLVRPLESTNTMPTKIKVLQFLAWINEGERLDLRSGADHSLAPLELALKVLQSMKQDCCQIPQQDYEKVCTSVKEMIVRIFIKNGEFDKAKKALNKHFPKPMVGKKAIFMGLINQKSKVHDLMDQKDFHQFKGEMLGFCQKLCEFSIPFLLQAALKLVGTRHTEPDDNRDEADQQEEPRQHSCESGHSVHGNRVFIERSRLEAAFSVLATGSDKKTCSDLEEDIEEEEHFKALPLHLSPSSEDTNGEIKDQPYLRNTGSPLEASPADAPPQMSAVPQAQTSSLSKMKSRSKYGRDYTISQLVLDPDSPGGSQGTAASQDLDSELTTKETVESQEISKKIDTQSPLLECEISKPVRKHSIKSCDRARASSSVAKLPAESEEELSDSENEMETAIYNTSRATENEDVITVIDCLDKSPSPEQNNTSQKCSTPHKDKITLQSKWKQAFKNAKESKEVWSDEEILFDTGGTPGSPNESTISNSGQRKRKWTDSETQRLKDGVRKFGEGNWSKIKAYYNFKDRTNVNLKDRWRTMKKLKMV